MRGQIRTFRNSTSLLLTFGALLGWFAIATGTAGSAFAQTAGLSWTNTGNLNVARAGHTATLLPNGKVLVIGGSSDANRLGSAELYDPVNGNWTFTGSLNVITGGCATLLPTRKVLVVGGGRAELYDPSTGAFTVTGNMTEQANCSTATLLPNGRVLVTTWIPPGPADCCGQAATPELYDPSSGTFSPTGRFADTGGSVYGTAGLAGAPATLLPNGTVLIAAEPTAQLYDPVSGTFSLTGAMTTPCVLGGTPGYIAGRTATLLRTGKVLVTGGEHEDCGRFSTAELYDPSSRTFTATGHMTRVRNSHTATLLPDGRVLITGGETDECSGPSCSFAGSTASAEIFDPATGTFNSVALMAARREWHTATLLNNGRVLVAGGLWYAGIGSFMGILASAELYNALSTPVSNPIDDAQFFVRQHYLDFLSREPEIGEPWTAVLNNCPDVNNDPGCDRITVSAAFFGSPEFQLKGYFVYRFYKLAFNRLPAFEEIVSDMQAVTGQTPNEVFQKKAAFTNAFAQRMEFTNNFGAITNAQYVSLLLDRHHLSQINTIDPAAPDGTNRVILTSMDLITQLDTNTLTRAQVLRAIADSNEVFTAEYNRAFVAMQYYGYLRRTPEAAGYNAWLNYLNANPTDFRTMVNGFVNSIEYRSRFAP